MDVSTDQVIANITAGSYPVGALYDPINGYVYVTSSGASPIENESFTVIDGSANRLVNTIPISGSPSGIDLNVATNEIYVGDHGSSV